MITLTPRDRRALAILVPSVIVALAIYFWPQGSAVPVVQASGDPVAAAEKRLARLRDTAATVAAKEEIVKKLDGDLAEREKGLIQADTAAQAQAQVIQILRRLGASEAPPIELRATELNATVAYGDYGQVNVAVQVDCRIDQLINLVAAISNQPELLSTNELRITSSNVKEKTIGVRLAVSGIVDKKLVPQKKGAQ